MRALAIAAILTAAPAAAEPLAVVVRGDDSLAGQRLRGQLADLDLVITVEPGALEPTLDAQLVSAGRLAEAHGARVVVWFVPRGRGLAVAIATPGDHRLFVREIPPANASAVAEAAAVAARGALRAIALGGTIGVAVPPTIAPEPAPAIDDEAPHAVTAPAASIPVTIEGALGWQVALDGGADRGAHAVAGRATIARGAWASSLALAVGLPLRHAIGDGVALDLARSSVALGLERRLGPIAIGVSGGIVLYHRTTLATPDGLAPTPGSTTVAFVGGPELLWRWRSGRIGVLACAALDAVAGAPELAVAGPNGVESVGQVRAIQGRFTVSVSADYP